MIEPLTKILNSYCRKEICANILLIEEPYLLKRNKKEKIEKYGIRALARSKNTNSTRKEKDAEKKLRLINEDTNLCEIFNQLSPNKKPYIYITDLKKHQKKLKDAGKEFKCLTYNWEDYFVGTMIIPIRIANSHLHYDIREESYNIIGFLYVESISNNAFLSDQENYNISIAKAFASEIYIMLNIYNCYMNDIDKRKNKEVKINGTKSTGGKKN